MSDTQKNSYAQSGVDYSAMDPIKVLAQKNAAGTAGNLAHFNASEVSASRGESAYVWEEADSYRSLVIEGLGTKNLVADAMRAYGDKTYYDSIAQDLKSTTLVAPLKRPDAFLKTGAVNKMATTTQLQLLKNQLSTYKKRYLRKEFSRLDESATRIMTNYFLTDILGYKELDEIKTEYRIRSEYADYVVQLKRKKHFVVEVKSIDLDLNEKHLRQSLSYAANEGIDWILLLNGREIQLFRVNFGKPITTTLIYKLDLMNNDDFKKAPELLWNLTKKAVEKGDLEIFWKRTNALTPSSLAKLLYSEEVVKRLRNDLKEQTGIYFQMEDVAGSLCQVITQPIEFPKPKLRIKKKSAPLIKTPSDEASSSAA